MSSSNEIKLQRDKPLVVVLDGGAFMGTVQPGFVSYLQEKNVAVSAYAGLSIGSLISTLVCNERNQADMRRFMLDRFCKGMARGVIPPIANPLRLLFGGVMDQVPIMRGIVSELGLSPKPNLRIVAYDLLSRKVFVFEGEDYDLAIALAASCSPYPVARPVEYRDANGKRSLLVDACVYLAHKRIFEEQTIIARLFNVKLRREESDEVPVLIGHPRGKIVKRPSAEEYDAQCRFGYIRAAQHLGPLLRKGKLPLLGVSNKSESRIRVYADS